MEYIVVGGVGDGFGGAPYKVVGGVGEGFLGSLYDVDGLLSVMDWAKRSILINKRSIEHDILFLI